MAKNSEEKQMSLWADSHANPSQSQAGKKEKRTTGISGLKCYELLPTLNLGSLLERTCQALLTCKVDSKLVSLTWKTKVTKYNVLIFQLAVGKPCTEDIESSSSQLWATPQAMDGLRGNQIRPRDQLSKKAKKGGCSNLREQVFWATPNTMDHLPARKQDECSTNQKNRKGRSRSGNLREQAVHPKMWPTPRVSDTEGGIAKGVEKRRGHYSRKNKKGMRWGVKLKDAVDYEEKQKMYPTPRSREGNAGKAGSKGSIHNAKRGYLDGVVQEMYPTPTARDHKDTGKAVINSERNLLPQNIAKKNKRRWLKGGCALNSEWVEWLMGFPPGWTDEDNDKDMKLTHWEQQWDVEPDNIPRVIQHGKARVARLKALGNAVVPQMAQVIGACILKALKK
jgi:hypothetical protein